MAKKRKDEAISINLKPMVKLNIFFQDLAGEAQEELWRKVRKELLAYGLVEYRGEEETEEEFETRLTEETDHYIDCHNFANRFEL